MPDHPIIKLVCEVIDRISIEFNICFLIDSFEPQFKQVAWSSQLLILKHITHFIVAEYRILCIVFLFSEDIWLKLLILVILLISLLAVPGLSRAKTEFEASLNEAAIENLWAKYDRRFVSCYSHRFNRNFEFVLEVLLEIWIGDMLRNLVQDDRPLRFITAKKLWLLHFRDHLIVLVGCFDVFPEEGSTNTSLKNKDRLRVFIPHFDLWIEASLWDVHALESSTDFFNHLSNFFKNVEIEVAIAAPLPFMEGWPAKPDPSLLNVTSSLIILRLKSHLLLLLSTWIIGIDLLVFELRVKLVDPLIVNPEKHYRVGVAVVVIVALKLR